MKKIAVLPQVLEQFDAHNESLTTSKDTITKNKTIRKRLAAFIQFKYGKSDLSFIEVDKDFADQFHEFLMEEFNLSNNTAVTYIWMMGKIFRYAQEKGIPVPVDPSQYYSYKKNENRSVKYLNQSQLEAIHQLKIGDEKTDLVRDLFLYSCYTGMSLEELKTVSYDDLRYKDEIYWLTLKRGESFKERYVPCLPELLEIDKKYKEEREKNHSRVIFPKFGNISTGKYLKQIKRLAGIPFPIKFETARYTYATTVALKYQLPLYIVHEVLGYKKIQDTVEYQQLWRQHVERAFGERGNK